MTEQQHPERMPEDVPEDLARAMLLRELDRLTGEQGITTVEHSTEAAFGAQAGPGVLVNVHPESKCAGRACVIHNPSEHHMREWPLLWRDDKGQFERQCPHDIGHPDPDQLPFWREINQEWRSVHGCDGCCSSTDRRDA